MNELNSGTAAIFLEPFVFSQFFHNVVWNWWKWVPWNFTKIFISTWDQNSHDWDPTSPTRLNWTGDSCYFAWAGKFVLLFILIQDWIYIFFGIRDCHSLLVILFICLRPGSMNISIVFNQSWQIHFGSFFSGECKNLRNILFPRYKCCCEIQ